jgi:hypothetical protein
VSGAARRRRYPVLWWTGWVVLVLAALPAAAVVSMALWFQASPAPLWIAIWIAALLGALVAGVRRGPGAGLFALLACIALISLWWMTILPTNDRDWQPEVAELLTGEIDPADPDRIVLHNIRNFAWRTPSEVTERWETREYDLGAIESADIILTYWAGPAIAHTMVSFGFANGEHLVYSIGIRPTRGQAFSSIAGFFKVYELIITAADERDAVRLRTSVQQGNRVHLYRLRMDRAVMRELFVEYVEAANALAERPRFYRTILDNCTTIVWKLADRITPGLPIDWRVVLSGYLPGYLHDRGALDPRYPLDELTRLGRLPAQVEYDGTGPGFSAAIRAGIPPL